MSIVPWSSFPFSLLTRILASLSISVTPRSPSPPPTYDAQGRRTNTRDIRYRRKLENERIALVERAMKNDPHFQAPAEYHQQKRSHRPQDKVYIPVKEFPEINFFGLLVGPRGNSLKTMERDSGAKISIRGKGSVKEGKGRPDAFADDAEEDLHCLIMADTQEKVAKCVALINRVIETVRVSCSLLCLALSAKLFVYLELGRINSRRRKRPQTKSAPRTCCA